ncbi:MAG: hypothetical protein QNJ74_11840 [Trichodesmium sp. MO_231.B1]|nr:hypothetical protein [Trichodesmium sp. MO_231.B1]
MSGQLSGKHSGISFQFFLRKVGNYSGNNYSSVVSYQVSIQVLAFSFFCGMLPQQFFGGNNSAPTN